MRRDFQTLFAVLLSVSFNSAAADVSARIEASAAIPVGEPLSQFLSAGPGVRGSVLVSLTPFLAAQANVGFLYLLPQTQMNSGGSSLFAGLGLRLARPALDAQVVPWFDASIQFNRTGTFNSVSAEVGAGIHFRFNVAHVFWLGPQARYMRVFKLQDVADSISGDANIVSLGLGGEFDFQQTNAAVEKVEKTESTKDVVVVAVDADPDNDGVSGSEDLCPRDSGPVALHGCPDKDDDKDGIANSKDACPRESEDKDGFQDSDGCPENDNDNDGVADPYDSCPDSAGPVASRGCPDTDGDKVANDKDNCPNLVGTADNFGCPKLDDKLLRITESKIELLQKVFFVFGNTNIVSRSFRVLNEVGKALKDREKLCVEIEGHTDNIGDASKNLALSTGRAQAVLNYLAEQGIRQERMSARGFGDTMPLESNAKPEGRERNRRVEFNLKPCGKK
jgi:outer membrane protein OmpA-like peptidoglycan-associated protein